VTEMLLGVKTVTGGKKRRHEKVVYSPSQEERSVIGLIPQKRSFKVRSGGGTRGGGKGGLQTATKSRGGKSPTWIPTKDRGDPLQATKSLVWYKREEGNSSNHSSLGLASKKKSLRCRRKGKKASSQKKQDALEPQEGGGRLFWLERNFARHLETRHYLKGNGRGSDGKKKRSSRHGSGEVWQRTSWARIQKAKKKSLRVRGRNVTKEGFGGGRKKTKWPPVEEPKVEYRAEQRKKTVRRWREFGGIKNKHRPSGAEKSKITAKEIEGEPGGQGKTKGKRRKKDNTQYTRCGEGVKRHTDILTRTGT